jgi:hypothetical protein
MRRATSVPSTPAVLGRLATRIVVEPPGTIERE